MPPANSIRDDIVDDLKTTLGGITAGAAYNYTTASVFDWRTPGASTIPSFPAVSVWDLDERVEWKAYPLATRILRVTIQAIHACEPNDDPAGVARKMLHDIQKAVVVDHTRGGVAVDTLEVANRVAVDAPAEPYVVVEVDLDVHYRTNRADPASANP